MKKFRRSATSLYGPIILAQSMLGCGLIEIDHVVPTPDPAQVGDFFDPSGSYALKFVTAKEIDVSCPQKTQSTIMYSVGTIVREQDSPSYLWQDSICTVTMDKICTEEFSLDEGFYAHSTPPIRLQISDYVGGSLTTAAEEVEVFGAVLDDPYKDSLPTDPADPRVTDYDSNGAPGFDVVANGYESGVVWTVQRNVYSLSGSILDSERIFGLVEGYSELSGMDSENADLMSLMNNSSTSGTSSDPEDSYFEFVRVSDSYGCEGLLEAIQYPDINDEDVFSDY